MALIEHYIALYEEYKRILTERQFEVMWLKEIEGLSGKEVAAKLGISQSAVSRHFLRGMNTVRKALKKELNGQKRRGLCLTLGEDTDPEATPEEYAELVDQISIEDVLKAAMLDGLYTPADCRLISPEEYDRKYGEGEDTYGKL